MTVPGPGWWQATDGRWYPPQPVYQQSYRPAPKKSALRWPVRILLALVLAAGGILAGIAIQGHRTNGASVSSEIAGTTMTVSDLDGSVSAQVAGAKPGGFGVSGVSTVSCIPPNPWAPGKSFSCVVFGSGGHDLGEYDAEILPADASGTPQWNGSYTPVG